ncbi:hypothetical protein TGGT1_281530 [Toxoplasma gondii GT1]|uniref:Uncharacterized protein n=1 Tax=Toxoplasma gondii (strain ATCC 50853 / GT1) TaxID=507601 RepID=S7UVA1_TOXGG|nr:hypothetical protein TGGT1_281530 [Toxoplasma gondii GT1]
MRYAPPDNAIRRLTWATARRLYTRESNLARARVEPGRSLRCRRFPLPLRTGRLRVCAAGLPPPICLFGVTRLLRSRKNLVSVALRTRRFSLHLPLQRLQM